MCGFHLTGARITVPAREPPSQCLPCQSDHLHLKEVSAQDVEG